MKLPPSPIKKPVNAFRIWRNQILLMVLQMICLGLQFSCLNFKSWCYLHLLIRTTGWPYPHRCLIPTRVGVCFEIVKNSHKSLSLSMWLLKFPFLNKIISIRGSVFAVLGYTFPNPFQSALSVFGHKPGPHKSHEAGSHPQCCHTNLAGWPLK